MALDAKLDSEQKAAKIVAQDITRYVESMKQLERQAESDKKTKLNQANQITSLQKQLKQESDEKKKLQNEMSLSSKITSDTLCETCLDRSTSDHLANSTVGKGNVLESAKETASIVSALEDQVRVLTKEKLHLEQRLSYSSYPGLATNSIFFLFPFFVKKSLICLEGKSMTPHRGNTVLFRSSQQLPRLRLGPSKGFLS